VTKQELYGMTYISGEYQNVNIHAMVTGMGKSAAAAGAQLLIYLAKPRAVIFTGIAGGLNPALNIGDIVVGSTLRYLETNEDIIADCKPYMKVFHSDNNLVSICSRVLDHMGFAKALPMRESLGVQINEVEEARKEYVLGTIATSDQFNTDENVLDEIRSTIFADCEEMEGASVAHISAKCNVPFLAIRAISNQCGESYEEVDSNIQNLHIAAQRAGEVALGVVNLLTVGDEFSK
ncbi:MAG: 5'-methylthioadenosine/S-adenosylhomocysteine nucleosidase, partial [Bifidobacteriaceae bacterium]|nr:5'-methylthioadenosine/S-adenosylhomocysteine nucleosidase [Bifidobacteriaceae bacterium]